VASALELAVAAAVDVIGDGPAGLQACCYYEVVGTKPRKAISQRRMATAAPGWLTPPCAPPLRLGAAGAGA
jgi:hypothetical protein